MAPACPESSEVDDWVSEMLIEPGAFNVLPYGVEVTTASPPETGNTYEAYTKTGHRYAAAVMGVLYQEITGDWEGASDRTHDWHWPAKRYQNLFQEFNAYALAIEKDLMDRDSAIGELFGMDARKVDRAQAKARKAALEVGPATDIIITGGQGRPGRGRDVREVRR